MRDAIAAAVRDAIEAQDPAVLEHKREITAWLAAHPAGSEGAEAHGGSPLAAAVAIPHGRLLLLAALLWALWLVRRRLRPLTLAAARVLRALLLRIRPVGRVEEWLFRRRRRQARRRRLLERSRPQPHRRSVYDELWF